MTFNTSDTSYTSTDISDTMFATLWISTRLGLTTVVRIEQQHFANLIQTVVRIEQQHIANLSQNCGQNRATIYCHIFDFQGSEVKRLKLLKMD